MLDKPRPKILKQLFENSVETLEHATRRARLVRKIEDRCQYPENASLEELLEILNDLRKYRHMIQELDYQLTNNP